MALMRWTGPHVQEGAGTETWEARMALAAQLRGEVDRHNLWAEEDAANDG